MASLLIPIGPICSYSLPNTPASVLPSRAWSALVARAASYGLSPVHLTALFTRLCAPHDASLGTVHISALLAGLRPRLRARDCALLELLLRRAPPPPSSHVATLGGGAGEHDRILFEQLVVFLLELCALPLHALAPAAAGALRDWPALGTTAVRAVLRFVAEDEKTVKPGALAAAALHPLTRELLVHLHTPACGAFHSGDALAHLTLRYPLLAFPLLRLQRELQRLVGGRALWQAHAARSGGALLPASAGLGLLAALTARVLMLEAASSSATPFLFGTAATVLGTPSEAAGVVDGDISSGAAAMTAAQPPQPPLAPITVSVGCDAELPDQLAALHASLSRGWRGAATAGAVAARATRLALRARLAALKAALGLLPRGDDAWRARVAAAEQAAHQALLQAEARIGVTDAAAQAVAAGGPPSTLLRRDALAAQTSLADAAQRIPQSTLERSAAEAWAGHVALADASREHLIQLEIDRLHAVEAATEALGQRAACNESEEGRLEGARAAREESERLRADLARSGPRAGEVLGGFGARSLAARAQEEKLRQRQEEAYLRQQAQEALLCGDEASKTGDRSQESPSGLLEEGKACVGAQRLLGDGGTSTAPTDAPAQQALQGAAEAPSGMLDAPAPTLSSPPASSWTSLQIAIAAYTHVASGAGAACGVVAAPCLLCGQGVEAWVAPAPAPPPAHAEPPPLPQVTGLEADFSQADDSRASVMSLPRLSSAEEAAVFVTAARARRAATLVATEMVAERRAEISRRCAAVRAAVLDAHTRARSRSGGGGGEEEAEAEEEDDATEDRVVAALQAERGRLPPLPQSAVAGHEEEGGRHAHTSNQPQLVGGEPKHMALAAAQSRRAPVPPPPQAAPAAAPTRAATLRARKVANTGFCAPCDALLYERLARAHGYRAADAVLDAAAMPASACDLVAMHTARAHAEGQPLSMAPRRAPCGGGRDCVAVREALEQAGSGAAHADACFVQVLDEESKTMLYYDVAVGESQWEAPSQGFSPFEARKGGAS